MGIVGGLFPSPLHLIALAQVALNRWARAIFVLLAPPLAVDAVLFCLTFFFYQFIPHNIAHYVAYGGGTVLLGFGIYALAEKRYKSEAELAASSTMTYASVTVATLAEVAAPGTWVYWLTLAGPIIAEGRVKGYWRIVPFFAGGMLSYYGAALFSVWVMAWGAGLHEQFKRRLFLIANLLLVALGIYYLVHAYRGG